MTVLPVMRIRGGVGALGQQGVAGGDGGRPQHLGQAVGEAAVGLLRVGIVEGVGAQAGFHVGHGDLAVEGGECGGERGGRVAVHQHHVGALGVKEGLQPLEDRRGDVRERLGSAHHAEIVVDGQAERVDHLVEHLAVLTGQARDHPEPSPPVEFQHDRGHLDGLGTGAEADEEGAHGPILRSGWSW